MTVYQFNTDDHFSVVPTYDPFLEAHQFWPKFWWENSGTGIYAIDSICPTVSGYHLAPVVDS